MDWLLKLIFSNIVEVGRLKVTSASGHSYSFGDGSGRPVAIRFTSASWQFKALLDPELRLGEAYMDEGLVMDQGSLAEFLDLIIKNLAGKQPTFWAESLRRLRTFWRRAFRNNTMSRATRNARHHYNIDARLYRLFLDPDMQYSCAYFENEKMSLEDAQIAKKRHIANKLLIDRPGLRVLDIGSGWGGLSLHLSRSPNKPAVTGINLSNEQVALAQDRAAKQPNCNFRIQDYRNLNETFDRIVSVGMFEHVGKHNYPAFFSKCHETLSDDGVMLLHSIGRWDGPSDTNAWVWKYIFPGGYIPALSELTPIIEKSGFIISDIEVLRLHYAETLRHWRERFLAKRQDVLNMFDGRFVRMWEFYLAAFEPSFRYYGIEVFQIQLIKKVRAAPITRDYMYDGSANEMMRAAE
jgi:cyclopropane-fatty-acyl-phospholipid synthase